MRNLTFVAGFVYDFFATGDTLLNVHPYNLQVQKVATALQFDNTTGCTILPGIPLSL